MLVESGIEAFLEVTWAVRYRNCIFSHYVSLIIGKLRAFNKYAIYSGRKFCVVMNLSQAHIT